MYYTVRTTGAGIVDQLNQLAWLHELGRLLGYHYVHSPLSDSAHGFNGRQVDDFLGLGLGERGIDEALRDGCVPQEVEMLDLVGPEAVLRLGEVRDAIEQRHGRGPNVLYRLHWKYLLANNLAPLRIAAFAGFPFREKYWRRRKTWPLDPPFNDAPIKIALHVRRGDVAWFPFRGKYLVGGEIRDSSDATEPYGDFDVSRFLGLLESLYQAYDPSLFSIVALSDGFDYCWERMQHLEFTDQERRDLDELRARYEEEIRSIGRFPNVRLVMGRDDEAVRVAIHTLATADIIVRSRGNFAGGLGRQLNPNPWLYWIDIHGRENPHQQAVDMCRELLELHGVRP